MFNSTTTSGREEVQARVNGRAQRGQGQGQRRGSITLSPCLRVQVRLSTGVAESNKLSTPKEAKMCVLLLLLHEMSREGWPTRERFLLCTSVQLVGSSTLCGFKCWDDCASSPSDFLSLSFHRANALQEQWKEDPHFSHIFQEARPRIPPRVPNYDCRVTNQFFITGGRRFSVALLYALCEHVWVWEFCQYTELLLGIYDV